MANGLINKYIMKPTQFYVCSRVCFGGPNLIGKSPSSRVDNKQQTKLAAGKKRIDDLHQFLVVKETAYKTH